MTLTDIQITNCKAQLINERKQLLRTEEGVLHSDIDRIDLKVERPNNSDENKRSGTIEKEIALENHVLESLAVIDLALARIDSNDYGVCVDCSIDIPYQRLQAFPAAARCVDCKLKYEKLNIP
jgi:DnaK suppressor protein